MSLLFEWRVDPIGSFPQIRSGFRVVIGYIALFAFACCFDLGQSLAQPPSSQPIDGIRNLGPTTTVLENAKIVAHSQKTIEVGSVLIRDGKILEVGANVKIPEGTKRIDLKGKTIYPGWIDAYTEVEIPNPENSKGAPYWNTNVVPQRNVASSYQPNAEQLTKYRKGGFTALLASPVGGIIRGTSCIVSTNATSAEKSLLASNVADHVRLTVSFRGGGGGGSSYPTSPMGAVALARQAFLDADWYRKAWQAYRAQSSLPQPENNAALQALADLIQSGRPIVFDASNEQFALRADTFANEFGLPMILHGSGREYRLLDQIAGINRSIIVPVNFPKAPNVSTAELASGVSLQELMHWELAPENPGKLSNAGCKIALTSEGLDDPSELRAQVRLAIERGLSPEMALDALTRNPAEMFGVDHLVGTIAIGKWANLIVTDGDLWGEKTKIDETWVQGERHRWTEAKPTELAGTWNLKFDTSKDKPTELLLKLPEGKLAGTLALPKSKEDSDSKKDGTESKAESDEPPSPSDQKKPIEEVGAASKPEEKGPNEKGSDEKKSDEPKSTGSKPTEKKQEFGSAKLDKLNRQDLRLTGTFDVKQLIAGAEGVGQLSLVMLIDGDAKESSLDSMKLQGTVVWSDGTVAGFEGSRVDEKSKKEDEKKDSKETKKKVTKEVLSKVNFPFGEFGRQGLPQQSEWVLIQNATIWTSGPQGKLENSDLLVHRGYIAEVGAGLKAPEGATIVNAKGKHVAPGIIDCHSHMASDGGINEVGQAVTAEVRIGDFIDANDYTIYCQLGGGVTSANILHGSANPIGGQNQVVKLRWGGVSEDLKMKEAPLGIKFALGENVKQSNRSEPGDRYPQSRMGVEQIMRDRFEAAKEYQKAWANWGKGSKGLPPRRDLELEALSEILKGERWIHCHSYRQDEILAMLRTLEDYNVRIGTLQHILEGYKVAEAMAKHGAMGSTFSDWWGYKFEVIDAIPFNGALMHRMGIVVSFNSDDNELGRHLNHEAAKAVKYGGISESEALKFVTLNPAKQLRIEAYVGSLEVGKQADFAIWNGSPLAVTSHCEETWIDGRKYFDRTEDLAMQKQVREMHQKLVQKVLSSDGPTAGPGERETDPSTLWPRYDEYCRSRK